jgi:hypothetical protein
MNRQLTSVRQGLHSPLPSSNASHASNRTCTVDRTCHRMEKELGSDMDTRPTTPCGRASGTTGPLWGETSPQTTLTGRHGGFWPNDFNTNRHQNGTTIVDAHNGPQHPSPPASAEQRTQFIPLTAILPMPQRLLENWLLSDRHLETPH